MHSIFSTNETGGSNGALREITRSLRRFCLLQELGADAPAIESESRKLDELITAYRAAFGLDALPDERLRVLLLDEQERVATAAAMSEMVAPLLAEKLQLHAPGAPGKPRPAAPPGAVRAAPARVNHAPAIADMIDSMLAQDDAGIPAWRRRGD